MSAKVGTPSNGGIDAHRNVTESTGNYCCRSATSLEKRTVLRYRHGSQTSTDGRHRGESGCGSGGGRE